mmetsp:Transcript_29885/g.62439  ORF Transcript_29885/g.62439 Transcript_29885/m.62439 type:complete len:247 (+) Transcript_29885:509-1249(+)
MLYYRRKENSHLSPKSIETGSIHHHRHLIPPQKVGRDHRIVIPVHHRLLPVLHPYPLLPQRSHDRLPLLDDPFVRGRRSREGRRGEVVFLHRPHSHGFVDGFGRALEIVLRSDHEGNFGLLSRHFSGASDGRRHGHFLPGDVSHRSNGCRHGHFLALSSSLRSRSIFTEYVSRALSEASSAGLAHARFVDGGLGDEVGFVFSYFHHVPPAAIRRWGCWERFDDGIVRFFEIVRRLPRDDAGAESQC